MPIDPDELLKGIVDPAERRYKLANALAEEKGIKVSEAMPAAESYLQNLRGGKISGRKFEEKEPGFLKRTGRDIFRRGEHQGETLSAIEETITGKQSEHTRAQKKTEAEEYLQNLLAEQAPTQGGVTTVGSETPGQPPAGQPGGGLALKMPGIPGTGEIKAYRKELGSLRKDISSTYEKASKRYGEMAADQIAATEAVAGAELAANEAQATVMEDAARKQLEFEGKLGEVERQRKEYVTGQMGKLNTAISRFQQMKLDPNRLFRNSDGSTNYPRKVTAVISVFLAGLGEQMQGRGGNPALDVIERAIERDMAAQESDSRKAQAGIGIQFNVLGTMRQLFGDEKDAVLGAKTIAWEHAKMELQQKALETRSPLIKAKAEQGIVEIISRQQQIATELEMSANESATKMLGIEAGLATTEATLGMQRAQLQTQQMGIMAKAAGAGGGEAPTGLVRTGPTNEKRSNEAVTKMGEYNNVKGLIAEGLALREQHGAKITPGKIKTEMESLGASLKLAAKELYGMGANWTEVEVEMLNKAIGGDLTALGWVYERLDAFDRRLDMFMVGYLKPRGYGLAGGATEGFKRES